MKELLEEKKLYGLDDDLWLTLSLAGRKYAVSCACIDSIFQVQQKVTAIPQTGSEVIGVITLRGMALPLVSLRVLLGAPTLEQEQHAFSDMLHARQQDHLRWTEELRRSIERDEPFSGATDAHQCAFGQWYDHYKTSHPTIRYQLNRIDEPHQNLHAAAAAYLSCRQKPTCGEAERAEILRKAALYSEQVVSLIEETISAFQDNKRSMCIALSDGVTRVGILVDEIHSAEKLTQVHALDETNCDRYVSSIGETATGAHVLLLNEAALFGETAEPAAVSV